MTVKRPSYHDEFIRLALEGLPPRLIAKRIGITQKAANAKMYVMRRQGTMPSSRPADDRYETRYGTVRAILDGLDSDARQWVLAQTPNGGTVGDVIRAILVDAYFEDLDG
tara:strand:- start:147 stop:476 length:330 start_codon:yes stop_codon:yes gene_type:complete